MRFCPCHGRPDDLDFRELKRVVAGYAPGTPLREAILREPDFVPPCAGLGKLEVYIRIAFAMRDAEKRAGLMHAGARPEFA